MLKTRLWDRAEFSFGLVYSGNSENQNEEKDMFTVGDTASLTKTFTESDVLTFAKISGDHNPVHIDANYAASTRFERQLVHGMLTAGMISAVLGMQLPGPGSWAAFPSRAP